MAASLSTHITNLRNQIAKGVPITGSVAKDMIASIQAIKTAMDTQFAVLNAHTGADSAASIVADIATANTAYQAQVLGITTVAAVDG